MKDKERALGQVEIEIEKLTHSPLYKYRKENNYLAVPGEGSPNALIMLIGEAPGEKEAKTGKPFIGRAGNFLNELLDSVNIKREEIFITSIVKDRPPKNRDPLPEEIKIYTPFLDRQIEIIQPKVIATLGRFAMNYIMERYGLKERLAPIGDLHGRVFEANLPWGQTFIVPLYHPAAAIYNQKLKETLKDDFK
ncbi:MAG: uracil-DNA glycosylase, partial [Parcubacteria group bacterium]